MTRLLQRLPFINLFDWANGEKYTIDDSTTTLTPVLAESDKQTDKAYNERYRKQPKKGNGGKGKESKFKEENKVEKSQLNKEVEKTPVKREMQSGEKEIID